MNRFPAPILLLALTLTQMFTGPAAAMQGDASTAVSEGSLAGSALLLEGTASVALGTSELVVGAVTIGAGAATVVVLGAGSVAVAVVSVPLEVGSAIKDDIGASINRVPCRGGTLLRVEGQDIAFVPDDATRRLMHNERVR